VYHIDNARDLDDLLSLQEHATSSVEIYEVHPQHTLSYQTPTRNCDFIFSATLPGLITAAAAHETTRNGDEKGGVSVTAVHNLLQSIQSSHTIQK
jgi:hypothetical protein